MLFLSEMSRYANAMDCDVSNLKLLFEGEVVNPNSTTADLDLDAGDEVQFDARIQ
jgi:hypothetical protein